MAGTGLRVMDPNDCRKVVERPRLLHDPNRAASALVQRQKDRMISRQPPEHLHVDVFHRLAAERVGANVAPVDRDRRPVIHVAAPNKLPGMGRQRQQGCSGNRQSGNNFHHWLFLAICRSAHIGIVLVPVDCSAAVIHLVVQAPALAARQVAVIKPAI